MRTPPNFLVRAYSKLLMLPQPAPDDTYDGGVGTVLPSRNFRRWSIWAPIAIWMLLLGVGWAAIIFADFFASGPEEFDVPVWVYAIAALVTLGFLSFCYAVAATSYYMLEYRFDDLGLHIRKGIGTVQEITLSYRNIQNVAIQRGPIDLWLGMSKLVVETAGGGGAVVAAGKGAGHEAAMAVMGHRGMMVGIDRFVAEDVRRDLIERMNRFHGAGLGDTSERRRDASRRAAAVGRAAGVAIAAASGAGGGFGRLIITSEQLELVRETIANIQRATEALVNPGPAAPYASMPLGFEPSTGKPAVPPSDHPMPPPIDPFTESTPIIMPHDRDRRV